METQFPGISTRPQDCIDRQFRGDPGSGHAAWRRCIETESATGIAAVQHPGGITLHSLFRLGIDEPFTGSFRLNIGPGNRQARHILAADLIIMDEVAMLTSRVANRVSMTIQSISGHGRIEFVGKRTLLFGKLLQFPPVVLKLSMPLFSPPITHLPY
jgi:hypothetical protein